MTQEDFIANMARCLNQAYDLGWVDKDNPQSIADYFFDFLFLNRKNRKFVILQLMGGNTGIIPDDFPRKDGG